MKMSEMLGRLRAQFAHAATQADHSDKVVVFEQDPDQLLVKLSTVKGVLVGNRDLWKNGLVKIICSDDELRRLAILVKEQGKICFSKAEMDFRSALSL